MEQLGQIKKIDDLRQVWKDEALDFTPWLAKPENIKLLGDTIGLDIEVESTESKIENFRADIEGVDINSGKKIIIENQLEESNHTHLGQIITYAAGKNASTIIWIVKKARGPHRAAIEWLNNHIDEEINFFLLEVELWQINDSLLAPKFNVIEQPNEWSKEVKKTNLGNETPAIQARLKFWSAFNDYAFTNAEYAKEFNKRKATTDHWYSLSLGSSSFQISILYLVQKNEIGVEFVSYNKSLFTALYNDKDEIESIIGQHLEWRELPEKKSSRILLTKSFDLSDDNLMIEEFDWIMNYTYKFKKAFSNKAHKFLKSKR